MKKDALINDVYAEFARVKGDLNAFDRGRIHLENQETISYEKDVTAGNENLKVFSLGFDTEGSSYEIVALEPNEFYPEHIHHNITATFHMLSGSGDLLAHRNAFPYKENSRFYVPSKFPHGFQTGSEKTVFLSVQNRPIIDPDTGKLDFEYA